MMLPSKNQNGFTTLEVVVVIASILLIGLVVYFMQTS